MTQDLTGRTVGHWTVIKEDGHTKAGFKSWQCRCSCGTLQTFPTGYINTAKPSMCLKCRIAEAEAKQKGLETSLIGTTRGTYTVIAFAGMNKYKSRQWLCRCSCGHERTIHGSYLYGNGVRSATTCFKCHYVVDELALRETTRIPDRFWRKFLHVAARRGQAVHITRKSALALLAAQGWKCALTGDPIWFTQVRKRYYLYTTASIDRIDSTGAYVAGNVQWVHKVANMMKQQFSQAEYITVCKKVARLHKHS